MATFKDIYDELMAGTRVRRTSWAEGFYLTKSGWIHNAQGTPVLREISSISLLDSDWEILEEGSVTITAEQFDEAHDRVLSYIRDSDLTYSQALKKELGL